MFKSVGNFLFEKQFLRLIGENEHFRRFCCKNVNASSKKSFNKVKINPFCAEMFYTTYPAFQRNTQFKNKQPIVLLSGILTFLGLKEKTPEEKDSDLVATIKKGILLIQRQQFGKAEQMLHLALRMAQDQQDEDGVTYIYDVLANLAFETGQNQKAEKLFINVLQRLIAKGEEQDSNKVVHISLKLAKIFQDAKDFKKAEQGFKFCIETLDKKLNQEDEDTLALWGMSMDWYARFLLGVNRNNDAFDCFKKAYDMCVKVNGVNHEQTVVLLNDLGTVSSMMGDTESAMNYFEEARDIGSKLPEMKDLAAIYINLGQLYLLREMYKESRLACQEGLKKARTYEDEVASSEAVQCLENIDKVLKNSRSSKQLKNVKQVLVN